MNKDINILHHVGLVTADMKTLVNCYEALGFVLTPVFMPKVVLKSGAKPEMLGVGTRCAIFQNNYLELTGIVDKNRWDKISKKQRGLYDIDVFTSRYDGLHGLYLGTEDIEAVRERLVRQYAACATIETSERMVNSPDGKQQLMSTKSIDLTEAHNAEISMHVTQNITPELVLQPRYMTHRNGVQSITEIIICTEEPEKHAQKYAQYTGHKFELAGNLYTIKLGDSKIIIIAPKFIHEIIPGCYPSPLFRIAGFTVSVLDLDVVRELLGRKKVPYVEHAGRIVVLPEHACGSAVIFEK
ncbi:MAG: VOC family protein [bacterium]